MVKMFEFTLISPTINFDCTARVRADSARLPAYQDTNGTKHNHVATVSHTQ